MPFPHARCRDHLPKVPDPRLALILETKRSVAKVTIEGLMRLVEQF